MVKNSCSLFSLVNRYYAQESAGMDGVYPTSGVAYRIIMERSFSGEITFDDPKSLKEEKMKEGLRHLKLRLETSDLSDAMNTFVTLAHYIDPKKSAELEVCISAWDNEKKITQLDAIKKLHGITCGPSWSTKRYSGQIEIVTQAIIDTGVAFSNLTHPWGLSVSPHNVSQTGTPSFIYDIHHSATFSKTKMMEYAAVWDEAVNSKKL